jgi:hypothetical protein
MDEHEEYVSAEWPGRTDASEKGANAAPAEVWNFKPFFRLLLPVDQGLINARERSRLGL